MALDPTVTQKCLGDGFYEQRLVREQIGQLTGADYLGLRRRRVHVPRAADQWRHLCHGAPTGAGGRGTDGRADDAAHQAPVSPSGLDWFAEKLMTGSRPRAASLTTGKTRPGIAPSVSAAEQLRRGARFFYTVGLSIRAREAPQQRGQTAHRPVRADTGDSRRVGLSAVQHIGRAADLPLAERTPTSAPFSPSRRTERRRTLQWLRRCQDRDGASRPPHLN